MAEQIIRVSLTKKQSESQLGKELIAICLEIIDDGELSDQEISDLKLWTYAQKETISAINYLREALCEYDLSTSQNHLNKSFLYQAIEKILPTSERKVASQKRKTIEQFNKLRNQSLDHHNFMVAGCRYEGRDKLISKYVYQGEQVILEREIGNPHDKYAVQVQTKHGHMIGYAPKIYSKAIANLLTDENKYVAYFSKLLNDYSDVTIPVVDAKFYKMEADETDNKGLKYVIPSKGVNYSGSGCGATAAIVFIAIIAGGFLMAKT